MYEDVRKSWVKIATERQVSVREARSRNEKVKLWMEDSRVSEKLDQEKEGGRKFAWACEDV